MAFDLRGGQANLMRLLNYNIGAFVHLASRRLLMLLSPILILMTVASMVYGNNIYYEFAVVVAWLLAAPQIFPVAKALSITSSEGVVFGKFNKSYLKSSGKGSNPVNIAYQVFPYAVIIIWLALLVLLLNMWFI